ncbi:MAG: hypothetical protein KKH44_03420 [Bacteroidetes bacterium]|nr:hypothetical protein [Bacteroidota bacterium]
MKSLESAFKALAIILFLLMLSSCAFSKKPIDTIVTADLNDVLKEIAPYLIKLKKNAETKNLEIKQVLLNFQTVSDSSSKAGLSLLVFSAGTSKSVSNTLNYSITLKELINVSGQTSLIPEFFENLDKLVNSADSQVSGLGTSEIKGAVKFVVTKKMNAGAKDFELKAISLNFGGDISQSHTQSIEIILSRKPDKSDAV